MAIIPQPELFSWEHVAASSDLDRLRMALDALPGEALMCVLEDERKGRRDDYPIRPVWNSVIAGLRQTPSHRFQGHRQPRTALEKRGRGRPPGYRR